MSSHNFTVLVFALLGSALVGLELTAHRRGSTTPTTGRLLRAALSKRPVIVLVVLAWWWIGWHFFVPGG